MAAATEARIMASKEGGRLCAGVGERSIAVVELRSRREVTFIFGPSPGCGISCQAVYLDAKSEVILR
jgi:hypothetical protein